MLKSLALSLGFAFVAHSPALSAALLPSAAVVVVGQVAFLIHRARRGGTQ